MSSLVILNSSTTSGSVAFVRTLREMEWTRLLKLLTAVESIRSLSKCLNAPLMINNFVT